MSIKSSISVLKFCISQTFTGPFIDQGFRGGVTGMVNVPGKCSIIFHVSYYLGV